MTKKEAFRLVIGGEFTAQPPHKPKLIPEDFLARFRNVKANDTEDIIKFANSYCFSAYVIPDQSNSIVDKFQAIQRKYNPMINNLLGTDEINYSDIQTINKGLKFITPQIVLRDKINDIQKIANGFDVHTLKSNTGEKPEIDVRPIGAFDVDKKASHIRVTVKTPYGSRSVWHTDRIKDGITKLEELFPSENWESQKDFLDSVVLRNGHIEFDKSFQPILIEMNFWLGKTRFAREELAAVWSVRSSSGESFIAKRMWDYLNSPYKGKGFKQCKICSDLHLGRSRSHCNKEGCRKEWDSNRHLKKN